MQVFNPQGKFITEWKDVHWPDNMCIDSQGTAYAAEVGAIYLLSGPNQPDASRPPARTSVRDPRVPLDDSFSSDGPVMMTLLRSALAAVNAEDLRDADDDVTSHRIRFPGFASAVGGDVWVRVYGTERQPFITEVYVNTDTRPGGPGGLENPNGYVAIELHNPYDVPIPLGPPAGVNGPNGWSIGVIDRRPTGPVRKKLMNLDGTAPSAANPPWRFRAGRC